MSGWMKYLGAAFGRTLITCNTGFPCATLVHQTLATLTAWQTLWPAHASLLQWSLTARCCCRVLSVALKAFNDRLSILSSVFSISWASSHLIPPQAGLSRATTGQVAACLFRSHLIYNPIIFSSIQIILNSILHSLQDSPTKLFSGKCRSAPAFQALSTLCLVRNARHKHIVLLISYLYLYLDSNETKTTHTHNTHLSKLKICWVFSTQPISPPLTFENLCSGSFDKHSGFVAVSKCCFCKI